MAKIAEAAGRQVASFFLGSAATLTVVLLLQYRPAGFSRTRAPAQFSGWRDDHRDGTPAAAARQVIAGGAGADQQVEANVAKAKANTTTSTTVLSDRPSTDHEEEVN